MSSDAASSWGETIREEIGAGQQAPAVEAAFPDEGDLLDHLAEGRKPSEADGIGSTTSNRIFGWVEDHRPDTYRSFHENNEAYCTEFVAREASDIDDTEFDFAFVCPRCGKGNPLKGDPAGFRNRPSACQRCRWVSCLTAEFLDDFIGDGGER